MVTRRPIAAHPLFAPLIALWLGTLFGLTVMVLPTTMLERGLAGAGLDGPGPLSLAVRVAVALAAAMVGAAAGHALARRFARRIGGDPRPVYAEADTEAHNHVEEPQRRRPLHVREELDDGFGDKSQFDPSRPRILTTPLQDADGFMILTPQPIHPPHPQPDLVSLLEQFDSAFAAFRNTEEQGGMGAEPPPGGDAVRSFVARQMGASGTASILSPLGGLVPDHQAELRAALDKLARSRGTV